MFQRFIFACVVTVILSISSPWEAAHASCNTIPDHFTVTMRGPNPTPAVKARRALTSIVR